MSKSAGGLQQQLSPDSGENLPELVGTHGRKKLARDEAASTDRRGNWMDAQRKHLQAYEYLCHIGEAKEWMEAILHHDLGEITKLEDALRNGVTLAKLIKTFEPSVVKKIFEVSCPAEHRT